MDKLGQPNNRIKAEEIFAQKNIFGNVAKDWVVVKFGEKFWLPRLEDQGIMCAYLWIAEQIKYPNGKGGELVREYLSEFMDAAQMAYGSEKENAYNFFSPEFIFRINERYKIPNRNGLNITKFSGYKK